MSRRHSSQSASVSLFPFLAVLICTMGALILMLLVTTRQIRRQEVAEEAARRESAPVAAPAKAVPSAAPPKVVETPQPNPERERLVAEAEKAREEIAKKRMGRDQLERTLKQERERLAAAKKEFERVQGKLDEVQGKLEAGKTARQNKVEEHARLTEEEQTLLADLEHARKKLMELKSRQQNAQGEFSLVPFDGKSGTTRRPIFIECTEEGLRILPENLLLTASDLNGFSERMNPLLIGTQALTEYWTGRGDVIPESYDRQNPPYVMLIVRPSGTAAYYIARRLLSRYQEPFGYELIEEDYPLHVPTPDPQAVMVLRRAVELAIASREEILHDLRNRRVQSQDVVEVKTLNTDEHAAEEMRRIEEKLPSRGGSVGGTLPGGSLVGGGKPGVVGNVAPGGGQSFKQALQDSVGNGGGNGENGLPVQGGSAQNASGAGGVRGHRGGTGDGGAGKGGEYARFSDVQGEGETGVGANSGGAGTGMSPRVRRGKPMPAPIGDEAGGPSGAVAESEGGDAGSAGAIGEEVGTPGEPGGEEPVVGREASSEGEPTVGGEKPRGAYRSVSRQKAKGGNEEVVPDRNRGQGMEQGVEVVVPDVAERDSVPLAKRSVPAGAVPKNVSARSRWGGNSGAGIGMQKKILIDVKADRIIVAEELEIEILEGESRPLLSRRLMGAIDWAASQWGEPNKNYYWIPVVRFRVHPGCLPQQARLQGILQDWGVSSTVEFLKADSSRAE